MGLFNKVKEKPKTEQEICSICGSKDEDKLSSRRSHCGKCEKLEVLAGRGYWGESYQSKNPSIVIKSDALILLLKNEKINKEKYKSLRDEILEEEKSLNEKELNKEIEKAKKLFKVK